MKSLTYNLLNESSIAKVVIVICKLLKDRNNKLELVIRNRQDSATHAQFKAIFGTWFDYIQNNMGRSKEYYHAVLKQRFLTRIYQSEPIGSIQEIWSENVNLWLEKGDIEKSVDTLAKISLSWATKEQMCKYMNDIEIYFIEIGSPLPPIESEEQRKTYENFKQRIGL